MVAELRASVVVRAEEAVMVTVVPGEHGAGVCVGPGGQHGLSVGDQNQQQGMEHGVGANPSGAHPRLPDHFARRIADTAAGCFDFLLQKGIQTLSFVEVVHVLGAWHENKDRISREVDAGGRLTETEHGAIATFLRRLMTVAVGSLSGDLPKFPFDLNSFLWDASGVLNTELEAVTEYSKVRS